MNCFVGVVSQVGACNPLLQRRWTCSERGDQLVHFVNVELGFRPGIAPIPRDAFGRVEILDERALARCLGRRVRARELGFDERPLSRDARGLGVRTGCDVSARSLPLVLVVVHRRYLPAASSVVHSS
jgi:hypothetical protein